MSAPRNSGIDERAKTGAGPQAAAAMPASRSRRIAIGLAGRLLRAASAVALLAAAAVASGEAQAVDRKVALVIGNADYKSIPPLKNPANDVVEVSNTFRIAGFEVFVASDLSKLAFEEQFRNYLAAIDGAELAVVYYSGHGFQIGGENFLIPVDADLKAPADVEVQAIKLNDVLAQMRAKSKVQIVVLDACRNTPFPRKDYWLGEQLVASEGPGLAQVKSSLNTLIAFSTEPGAVAYDGAGEISPFSDAFARRALAPNQEIRTVMASVRRDVVEATKGMQVPWENSSLVEEVVFVRRGSRPAIPPVLEKLVVSGAEPVELDLPEPVAPDGGTITVTVEKQPNVGKLMLDGREVASGGAIAGADLPRLEIAVPPGSVSRDEVDVVAYTARDEWGGEAKGIVVLRVTPGDGPDGKLMVAALEQEEKQLSELRGIRIAGTAEAIDSRTIPVPVGVGPVPLGLKAPEADAAAGQLSLRLAGYPGTGVLSLPDRVLTPDASLMAEELASLRYEPQVGERQGVEVSFEIRAEAGESKPARMTLAPQVDACDEQAAEPLDLQGVATGRLPNEIADEAVAACEKAVAAYPDVPRFQHQLGRALLARRDVPAALEAFKTAADRGHVRSLFQLGYMHATGTGVPVDRKKANEFYKAASDKGDPYGMTSWGRALFNGNGVEMDTTKGLDLLLQAAALGHTYAMNDLGTIFTEGRNGVPADKARAVAFYRAGIDRQDMYSMNHLARLHLAGDGVERDAAKARELFVRATELGHPYAPTNLGRMYRDGVGVSPDLTEAARLFELAASRGDPFGAFDRAALEAARGTDGDAAVAVRYFATAIAVDFRNEVRDAQANLDIFDGEAKKRALASMRSELKSKVDRKGSIDEQLVKVARRVWEEANPRRDLF